MKKQICLTLVTIVFAGFIASCQSKKTVDKNQDFVNKLTNLKEFKLAEKRIDSIKQARNENISIGFDIVRFKEDSVNRNTRAMVNLVRPYDPIILFTAVYDEKTHKIISVEKNKTGTALDYLGWPKD